MSHDDALALRVVNAEPDETPALRRRIARLEADLEDARSAATTAERQLRSSQSGKSELKRLLLPLHRALQAIFDEIGEEPGTEVASSNQPISADKYTAWKQRLPAACGRVIDALLVHPMSTTQLQSYCKAHYNTVHPALKILNSNGLVEKSGNVWSLKR